MSEKNRSAPRWVWLLVGLLLPVVVVAVIFIVLFVDNLSLPDFEFRQFNDESEARSALADSFTDEALECANLDVEALLRRAEECRQHMLDQRLTTFAATDPDTLTQFKIRSLGCALDAYLDDSYEKIEDISVWARLLPLGARQWLPLVEEKGRFTVIDRYSGCVGAETLRTLRLRRANSLSHERMTAEERRSVAVLLNSEVCYHRALGNQRYTDDLAVHALLNIHWPNLTDGEWIDSELIPYPSGEWTDWRVNKALDVRQQMVAHNQDVGILERFGADIDLVEKILEDVSEAKNRCGLTTGAGSAVSDSEAA